MLNRRALFHRTLGAGVAAYAWRQARSDESASADSPQPLMDAKPGEDIFAYILRRKGRHDSKFYAQLLGAANDFKEGDEIVGVAAANEASRQVARTLLARTRLSDIDKHAPAKDTVYRFAHDSVAADRIPRAGYRFSDLKAQLLAGDEATIRRLAPGLTSDVVACIVKLLSNQELVQVSQKIFNPLPGTRIGARGYLGARIQPNSPTDNVDDIRWQVFDGWSYGVGDVLLGANPVSSEADSVAAVERTLQDLLATFEIDQLMPHCVLSHIDVQAEVENQQPGSTALWFQSIGGVDAANETFDIDVEKMRRYASGRTGKFGLYFETGQGADFTNGHGHGFDMVIHEARKYGFARALTQTIARAQEKAESPHRPWVHLNDVAGFIGPEVFRTRDQLVRCCLEDIVMGKLHGLCIGLDVCSTLHMDVSLDDLDWCLDQIMPANPAYLMALPTKIDPMLGYLTTGFQDHVRLRKKFGLRVNDKVQAFFESLGVLKGQGELGPNFGKPNQVFLHYRRAKGDRRSNEVILAEGEQQMAEVRSRGVFLAEGFGKTPSQLAPKVESDIRRIYDDAKQSIWAELTEEFVQQTPSGVPLSSRSESRNDYILHPTTGEQLSAASVEALSDLRKQHDGRFDVQLIISDGLNALAIMEDGQLAPFLEELRSRLARRGLKTAPENIIVTSGRVRAGYRIGEVLFTGLHGPRAIVHVIGERPGTGHRTFSAYLTAPGNSVWSEPGKTDHNFTKVVSGIALTALPPKRGAEAVDRVLHGLMNTQR